MSLRWGIMATGGIARRFAKGLTSSKTGRLEAVGSRTIEKAEAFCQEFGGRAHGSYQALLDDPQVDAVYIATPHRDHSEWTMKAARAGKHILCEKPFTLNAKEAEMALGVVRECGVFFLEAFMYRCHPQTLELKRLVADGVIGEPLVVNAEFGFAAGRDWGNFRTQNAHGGGGLMDVGTYCVSMSRLVAAEEPRRCEYVATLAGDGYDAFGTGCMIFPRGTTAMIGTGIHASLKNDVWIYGDSGRIHVPSPWFCDQPIKIWRNGASEPQEVSLGQGEDLYAIEADTVAAYLDAKEAPAMTWDDTLGNMRALDAMRASAGIHFEGEMES